MTQPGIVDVEPQPAGACPDCSAPHMRRCFRCGGEEIRHARTPGIVECKACSAREAFGEPMPRVVVQPHDDRRFVVVTVQKPEHKTAEEADQFVVDKALGRMIATALDSL